MRVAVDTGALLALASTNDQYHERATAIFRKYKSAGGRLVGTALVLGETHSLVLRRRGPAPARRILDGLLRDPSYEWVDCPVELVQAASNRWLAAYSDQGFSLIDAVTFELMRLEKLTHAFAFDHHFRVAGYELLGGRIR